MGKPGRVSVESWFDVFFGQSIEELESKKRTDDAKGDFLGRQRS